MSFQLHRGETIAIVGESGSGKSVTARTVMRLLTKRATIAKDTQHPLDGKDMLTLPEPRMRKPARQRISMIFQEPMSSLNPVYTVGTADLRDRSTSTTACRAREAMARALALLEEVQIPEPEARLNQYPHQLSGGQRQRVMIAMALANRPDVLIADEPTTALDVTVQAQILNLITELQARHGMAVILITHDLTVVQAVLRLRLCDAARRGEGAQHHRARSSPDPRHAYTQHLLASEPKGVAKPLAGDRRAGARRQGRGGRLHAQEGRLLQARSTSSSSPSTT